MTVSCSVYLTTTVCYDIVVSEPGLSHAEEEGGLVNLHTLTLYSIWTPYRLPKK